MLSQELAAQKSSSWKSWRRSLYVNKPVRNALGAQAIIFGGIGEDTPFVRAGVLEELEWCGLTLDPARNEKTINHEGRITTDSSRLHSYVIPVEEGLLIADQTVNCLKAS